MFFYPLIISKTKDRGRGVFADADIEENTLIERAPVIVMSKSDRLSLDKTLLHDYIFEWDPEGQSQCALALGYVSIYNHKSPSNAEYFMNYDTQTIEIHSTTNILKGEEITINYNGDWDNNESVWFETL